MKPAFIQSLSGSLLLAVALAGVHANAAPLPPIFGNVDFSGYASLSSGTIASENVVSILPDNTPMSGYAGITVQAPTEMGDYVGVPNGTAVTFATSIAVAAPTGPFTLWSFTVGSTTYSFEATTETVTYEEIGSPSLVVSGMGYASITGFANTSGTWDVDVTGSGAYLSFQSNALVPDSGTTALLILLGAVGIAIGALLETRRITRARAAFCEALARSAT